MSESLPNIYLAFWNLDVKEPPTVQTVRDELAAANLKTERAADVPPTTAMRRAADSLKTKQTETKTYTSKETQRTRTQIDDIREDEGKLRRTFIAQYELTEDDRPKCIAGSDIADFLPAFDAAITHYTGADISKVIQAILAEDGLGAYSPRKNGGIYFVPVRPEAADLLQRIERFCNAVQVRFLTYTVPDTAAQREEIADAIAQSYRDEITAHAEAIAAYTTETAPGHLANRKQAIQTTYDHMGKLRPLMNGRFIVLRDEMGAALTRLRNLETEQNARAEQQANERQQQGGRRIVAQV